MKNLLIVICSCVIVSCSNDGVPNNVLRPEKMKTVLWDFLRAEELSRMQAITDTTNTANQKRLALYNQVLAAHEISDQDFKESFQYYQQHPSLLKEVLDSLRRVPTPVSPLPRKSVE